MSKAAGRHTLLGNKAGSTRLSLAVPLKLFQADGRFLRRPGDVPIAAVKALASEIGVPAAARQGYDWRGRTIGALLCPYPCCPELSPPGRGREAA